MKDLIGAVLLVVSICAGTATFKNIHDSIRKAALEKAAQGLPSLTEMTKKLQSNRKNK